jgi:hypothetical protein
MQDKIFFSALLTRNASVSVTVGGVAVQAVWTDVPFDQVGVHHGSAVFGSLVGQVKVTVSRSGTVVASITGQAISTACTNGLANWNAITYAAYGPTLSTSTAPSLSIPYQNCTLGRAPGNFAGICDYTCYYGYCPIGACHCLTMGKPRDRPVWTGVKGYPAAGLGSSYGGLCAMACGLGNCMTGACSTVETDLVEPTVSPFLPPACVSGTGTGDFQGLCQYACNWGYCPRNTCTCLVQGILNLPTPDKIPGYKGVARYQTPTDSGLCDFACSRGYCPTGPCVQEGNGNILGCGMDDHEWRPECEVAELSCDFDYHYADLDALYAARRTIQPECLQTHTMQVLYDMLQRTLTWYNEVNLNYDKAFGHYQKHIKSTVQPALDEFMSEYTSPVGAGNKYFTCTWESPRESTIVQKCPIDYDHITYSTFTITYHLDDADGFFEELARTANVLPEWVDLAGWDREDCEQSSCPIINRERYNIPMENSSMVVPNPKDVALLAKPKLDELEIQLGVTYLEMMLGTWEGREDDPAMTLSLPLFMFHDAVSTMAEVKDIGEDAAAAEKKNLILTIVGALLLVIPFLGEAAAVIAGMGNVARIIAIAGIAGNAGLTVYEVIGDPKAAAETAPFVILELLGGRGFRSPKSYRSAASTRTAFNRDGAGKMGPVFRNSDTTLRGAATACKKKLA